MRVFRVLLGFFAVLFLALAGWLLLRGHDSQNWPSVKGHLDSVYIEALGSGSLGKGGGGAANIRLPIVRYRFSVNGKEHIGSKITLWDVSASRQEERNHPLLASGDISVFYNPSQPTDAVLIVGVPIPALTGLLFAAIACCLLFFAMPYFGRWLYSDYMHED
jgi:hypothetical protein